MAEINVVLHYDAGPGLIGRLQALAAEGLRIETCGERDDQRFTHLMSDAEVLWHVLRPVTSEVISRAPRLRLIQKIGVGVNTIDLEAARRRGILVCNMPGTNSQAVAEMTLLLMLATLRRLTHFDRRTRAGRGWEIDPEMMERLGEIRGRRVGLVGFGAVPTLLAPWLKAMGAEVAYTEPVMKEGVDLSFLTLEELLATSDIVSLHVPLTDATAQMINRVTLARMKPGRDPNQYRAWRPYRRARIDRGATVRTSCRRRSRRFRRGASTRDQSALCARQCCARAAHRLDHRRNT